MLCINMYIRFIFFYSSLLCYVTTVCTLSSNLLGWHTSLIVLGSLFLLASFVIGIAVIYKSKLRQWIYC